MQKKIPVAWEGEEQIAGFSGFVDLGGLPVLDTAQGVAGLGGDDLVYREVARVFLDHLPAAMQAMTEPGAPHELLPLVHELGSSLGTVGAVRAHRVARAIETRWRMGLVDDAARATALLRTLTADSARALSAALDAPAGR